MKESEVEQLGIFRIPIPIPFPEAGGPVNAYIIEEEHGLLLFDAGLGTETSCAALAEGFKRTGHRFQDVNRIVVSHGHIDHFGAAAWVVEQAGRPIPIFIHDADREKILESGPDWPVLLRANCAYLMTLGMPASLVEKTALELSGNPGFGRRLPKIDSLVDGRTFQCRHVALEVLHMPGHTRGVCCLYDRKHRLLFSADHLLERVSPNPIIDFCADGEPPAFKPLISYFESVERLRALDIDLVLPGHATPFSNCRQVIDSLQGFYRRRQEKILEILHAGPRSVYEIRQELFPLSDGFGVILMISETLGNLEVMEQREEIQREANGDLIRFRKVFGQPGGA
jgi:glyoxylase-like metal-dependent hydrolase (beta-lactamase superfamily II)